MQHVLITGANRGIGLEFTRRYLSRPARVYACCRTPDRAKDLSALRDEHGDRLVIVRMDVADEQSIRGAATIIGSEPIDVLVNNAGTFARNEDGVRQVDVEQMTDVFRTNAFGPVLVVKHLFDNLVSSERALVVNIISGVGFMWNRDREPDKPYSYGASKATLAMFTRYLSADLREAHVPVVGIGPGYVLTDMTRTPDGGPTLTPRDTVPKMIALMDRITMDDSGQFFEYDGRRLDVLV